MIHKLRDKKQIARNKRIIQTIVWVLIFILLVWAGLFIWSGKIFTKIGRPVWLFKNKTTEIVANSEYIIRTKKSVFNENTRLIQENTDLKNMAIDYQILKKENEQLRELFGRIPVNYKFILGTILTKPNRSPYDTIIIDIGSNVSINVGDEVFANSQTPIGRVSVVYDNTSLVALYSNPGQKTEALLDGSNASVELVGRGGGNFEMIVPIDLLSEKGTLVLSPRSSTEILAVIEKIISIPTDPVKKVILSSPVNIQNLKWVQVKKN
jgi:cell shape-determining protein MreC